MASSIRPTRSSIRRFAVGTTLVLAPAAWAAYDAGSTSSDILESCKDFGYTTESYAGVQKPALEMTCKHMRRKRQHEHDRDRDVSSPRYLEGQQRKLDSGATCSPNCPDMSELCTAFSISSSTNAVTLAGRCSTGSDFSPQCDTDANGSYNNSTCPSSTLNLADEVESPHVNNHLAACKDD